VNRTPQGKGLRTINREHYERQQREQQEQQRAERMRVMHAAGKGVRPWKVSPDPFLMPGSEWS